MSSAQQDFQQLDNRRHNFDELRNVKPIRNEIRHDVLNLLRKYYNEVHLKGSTPSESSRTTAPAHSEASTGTSITDITPTFSVDDRPVQPERATKPLDSIPRARKELMRKLGACQGDCRKRKVKCSLWHHSLYDLHEIEFQPGDKEIIDWGIMFDRDSRTPVATSPGSARINTFVTGAAMEERDDVIDQAVTAFNLPSGTHTPYAPFIQETDASLLRPEDVPPRSFAQSHLAVGAAQQLNRYNTVRIIGMFSLGTRDGSYRPAHYRCEFPDCIVVLPMQDLINHFEIVHFRFEHLNEPLRMVCPGCEAFYAHSNDRCSRCLVPVLLENLYGQYFPENLASMLRETGNIHSATSGSGPHSDQGPSLSQYQGPGFNPSNISFGYYSNFPCGSSPNFGGGYWYSTAKSALGQFKKSFLHLPSLPLRLLRSLVWRRKYTAALMIIAIISLVFGYAKHHWILSNLVQLIHSVVSVSPSKFSVSGVMIASVAFALHRIIIDAYHANGTSSSRWLSRCALNVFNVACRWQPDEAPRYALGYSRS